MTGGEHGGKKHDKPFNTNNKNTSRQENILKVKCIFLTPLLGWSFLQPKQQLAVFHFLQIPSKASGGMPGSHHQQLARDACHALRARARRRGRGVGLRRKRAEGDRRAAANNQTTNSLEPTANKRHKKQCNNKSSIFLTRKEELEEATASYNNQEETRNNKQRIYSIDIITINVIVLSYKFHTFNHLTYNLYIYNKNDVFTFFEKHKDPQGRTVFCCFFYIKPLQKKGRAPGVLACEVRRAHRQCGRVVGELFGVLP